LSLSTIAPAYDEQGRAGSLTKRGCGCNKQNIPVLTDIAKPVSLKSAPGGQTLDKVSKDYVTVQSILSIQL